MGIRYYIETFGCQMNTADTERMSALLTEAGHISTQHATTADLIIINGCSVREKAVHKAISALGTYQHRTPKPLLGLGGCVGQLKKGEVFSRAPYLDFVFGPDAIDELPEIVYRVQNGERHTVYADFDSSHKYSIETKVTTPKAQAYVNIMKGCDKYCSYCIVPFTRGREVSRTIDEVVAEVGMLAAHGTLEVTLLGQNVNSFGKGNLNLNGRYPAELHNAIGKVGPKEGEENFPQLLRAIDQDERCQNIRRIRFTSSHPLDFSDELIECYDPVNGVQKLAQHLHLPVQSGSNRILAKMGRHHRVEDYIAQMERLKFICPEVGISTDLIVGFPGEEEEDFTETLNLMERLQFDGLYVFAYSPRPGTKAAKLVDNVSKSEKSERLQRVLKLQESISLRRYQTRIGKKMELLVDHVSKILHTGERVWAGRTTCNRLTQFSTPRQSDLSGKIVQVKIQSAAPQMLFGELH